MRIHRETLRKMIEDDLLTQVQAANLLGCNRTSVERACKRFGLKTQRTGPRSGPGHPDWKGGRYIVGGYMYVWSPDHPYRTKAGYVSEQRLVVESKIGRYLTRGEVVHHLNGDRLDNRPENLQHFSTNAEHLRCELSGRSPNHTPEGLAKMAEAGRQTQIRKKLARDV